MLGYLSIVLHAHLPFVRHPEHARFLEEDWLFEAITETYLPLLDVLDGLNRDGVHFRLTLSLTPPLISMLDDELLRSRYEAHLERLLELTEKEIERTRSEDAAYQELAWWYHHHLKRIRRLYRERYKRDLVTAFGRLQQLGKLEIITCGATHGFLPLLAEEPRAVRAQLEVAVAHYEQRFGYAPRGIWLPECAFFPGIEELLADLELRFFILDTHGVEQGKPRPKFGCYAPIYTPAGPAAFARDPESSSQVWSAESGYPGDPLYRDFYRDLGYDRDEDYIAPYIHPDGIRIFTGIKYFAVTGGTGPKRPYNPVWARNRAAEHAQNFLDRRRAQVTRLHSAMGRPPLVLAPYDAELFGHWWFEGPQFIDFLLRKIHFDQTDIQTATPLSYLEQEAVQQVSLPVASSWGKNGYWEVWLNEKNDWIYPHLHEAARAMAELAPRYHSEADEELLRQMFRELLLAQSSDWPFLIHSGTAADYAKSRVHTHVARFHELRTMLETGKTDIKRLEDIADRDNLFPSLSLAPWR